MEALKDHGTAASGRRLPTLATALRERARSRPLQRAYVFLADGEEEHEHLTWGGLDERARAIAASLSRSCSPGDRALLLHPPGLDFVAAFFGCLYAGVIAVPAYPPRSPRTLPRLRAILDDAEPGIVMTNSATAGRLMKGDSRLLSVPVLRVDGLPAERAAQWRDPQPEPEDIAFLQYTSGSTTSPGG